MLLRSCILICGMVVSSSLVKAADCHIDNFHFTYGSDTSTHMNVKSGKSCGSTMTTKGGGLSSLAIAQSPQNGSATTPSSYRWEYKSARGFTGKDTFVVQLTGSGGNNRGTHISSGTTNISVDVDVMP